MLSFSFLKLLEVKIMSYYSVVVRSLKGDGLFSGIFSWDKLNLIPSYFKLFHKKSGIQILRNSIINNVPI